MKKLVALLTLIAGFAGGAQAADPPLMVDVAGSGYDWTGFYAGVFGGYGAGNVHSDVVPPGAPVNVAISGWLAGVDLGYNWQIDQLVLGIEADAAWANMAGSVTVAACGGTCGEHVNWLASVRGRVGFAFDSALLYATAGLAAASNTSTTSPPPGGTTGTFTGTYTGYVVGAGIEVAMAENVTIKAEYNYSAYGTQTAPIGTLSPGPITLTPTVHALKVGANWHF